MKSKQKSPSLSARVFKTESEVSAISDEVARLRDQYERQYGEILYKSKKKSNYGFDWFLIGFYVAVLIIYIYLLSKSKKQ